MGLAATASSGSSGGSAWTTATVAALIAAVLLVAGVSLPGSSDDSLWCVTMIAGDAEKGTAYGGTSPVIASNLSYHAVSTVQTERLSTQPVEYYGEWESDGTFWVIANKFGTRGDTVPVNDGDWTAPVCLFVVEDSSASHVESVVDGFQLGWTSR